MSNPFSRAALVGCLLTGGLAAFSQSEAGPIPVPLDDITTRTNMADHRVLPFQPLREADVFWEKRIWRVIDVREKLNQPFAYPVAPFFSILKNAIEDGSLTAYSTEDDRFTRPFEAGEVSAMLHTTDTVPIFDIETGQETVQVVSNDIDWEDVKRFRIKEVWYFDKNIGQLKVRILGIAPLISVVDKTTGDFKYEKPLFWVHYPSAREVLARHEVFNQGNDAAAMSWEDVMEMRQFASTIYKESNVADRRIEDYASGRDRLAEGQKIAAEIFNFESDLWSW